MVLRPKDHEKHIHYYLKHHKAKKQTHHLKRLLSRHFIQRTNRNTN